MTISFDAVFRTGGKELIELLEYCVFSVQMDPVFAFLVGEFRMLPTGERAIALYDIFCAPGAPARVSATQLLAPRDFRLERAIQPIRQPRMRMQDPEATPPLLVPVVMTPGKYLFDLVAQELLTAPGSSMARIEQQFEPALGAYGNLPGGRMTPQQKQFVERIWKPALRPRLVAAGFRRIANIGEP